MKKILLVLLMAAGPFFLVAQTIPRDMVILEIGTGTWCTYCPGAAMGADDLVQNGAHVAVVENHNGDPFANVYSNARNSYYGISGYPTAFFDGVLSFVGGSHTQSMVGNYTPLYNQRINTPSNFIMDMDITNSGLNYTAIITLTKVGTFSGTNLKLRYCVTVSNITYSWQGQTHLEFVDAKMVPDASGTAVNFASGNVQTITLNYSIDATWPVKDIEFIAFLQNDAGRECLQGMKRAAIDLSTDFTASSTQIQKNDPVTFTPTINGGYMHAPVLYNWLFPGGTPNTSSSPSPTVTYPMCGAYNVTLIVDKGGQIDTLIKVAYITVGTVVNINAVPNDTACTYQTIILDATTPNATSYLWQPGGATTPTISVSYPQYGLGSHTFTVTVNTLDGCESSKSISVFIDECTGIPVPSREPALSVYPNPANGKFKITYANGSSQAVDLALTNILGATVWSEKGVIVSGTFERELKLDVPEGIYFLTVSTGEKKLVKKVIIQ